MDELSNLNSPGCLEWVDEAVRKVADERARHKEMFAAAYFQATGIPPEEAVLVEQRERNGLTYRWWFERRKDD